MKVIGGENRDRKGKVQFSNRNDLTADTSNKYSLQCADITYPEESCSVTTKGAVSYIATKERSSGNFQRKYRCFVVTRFPPCDAGSNQQEMYFLFISHGSSRTVIAVGTHRGLGTRVTH